MPTIKINLNNTIFLLILLGVWLFPINKSFISFLRIIDIIFILMLSIFFFTNPKISKDQLFIALVASFLFWFSNFIGMILKSSFQIEKLAFLYKYIFILFIPWMVFTVINNQKKIKILNFSFLIIFFLMCCWTIIYYFLARKGLFDGSRRPSFPFSDNYHVTDAHLLSSYLGMFLIFYLFYFRIFFNHGKFLLFIISSNAFVALILTGSRTGLFLLFLAVILFTINKLFFFLKKVILKQNFYIKDKIIYYFFSFIFFFLMLIFTDIVDEIYLYFNNFFFNYLNDYTFRAFNSNVLSDQSSLDRISQLKKGMQDSSFFYFLFGLGFSNSLKWYDGIFSLLLSQGGILFVFCFILFYALLFIKSFKYGIDNKVFLMCSFLYIIANLITEYAFVSRNAFPVLVMLSLLYSISVKKELFKNKE